MGGALKNEFKKLFARPEITVVVILVCLMPFAVSLLLTLTETLNESKYMDLPENEYESRINSCRARLDASERAEEYMKSPDYDPFDPENNDPEKIGAVLSDEEKEKLRDEAELCGLLQEKGIFSKQTWQYALLQVSLSGGFADEAIRAILTDDHNYYYDKMISLMPEGQAKELFQKLRDMDVYPSYRDYRYLLFTRISDEMDTPEDRILIYRIENGIPEDPVEGSYGSFVKKVSGILFIISAVYCSFVTSYVFAEDRKNKVPHPSVVIPGAAKVIPAKILVVVIVLPLSTLVSFAAALSVGRLIVSGDLPRDVFLNGAGEICVKPFIEIVSGEYLKQFLTGGAATAVSGALSWLFGNEIFGIVAGGVITLFALLMIL